MIAIIYQFTVKENQTKDFMKAWKEMTQLIYEYENSLGSRLHKKDAHTFIAYAQWPDVYTFENAGGKLPAKASVLRNKMREACEKIEKLYQLELVEDLCKQKQFGK